MSMQKFSARMLPLAGAVALALGYASSVGAATATSNLSVTASVSANCSISTSAVAFGAYDPVGTHAASPLNGTGSVSVTCTSGASTTVTLGQGSNADTGSTAAAPLRRMKDAGTNFLSYALYSDTGRTTTWGDTAPTGLPHTGTGTLTALTVYGQIPAGQNVPATSYSDTVVATVTF